MCSWAIYGFSLPCAGRFGLVRITFNILGWQVKGACVRRISGFSGLPVIRRLGSRKFGTGKAGVSSISGFSGCTRLKRGSGFRKFRVHVLTKGMDLIR